MIKNFNENTAFDHVYFALTSVYFLAESDFKVLDLFPQITTLEIQECFDLIAVQNNLFS